MLINYHFINGQLIRTPENLTLFEKLEPYYAPSLYQKSPKLVIGSQGQTGAFSEFRQFYGYGGVHLNQNKSNGIAFGIFVSQEGMLISENRVDISYWNALKLSRKWNLSLSGKLGAINQNLGATKSTAGANSFSPNIGISVALSNEKTSISIALNQIGNFSVRPLMQEILYSQFLTSQITHTFLLSPDLNMNLFGNIRLAKNINQIAQAKMEFEFKEMIKPGAGINTSGIILSFSWDKIPLLGHDLEATFSSQIGLFRSLTPSSTSPYQIHLRYNLSKD